jgi:penicillin amidase
MDGASGEHDWDEMIPKPEMPLEVNPERGFVASANARPTAKESAHYLGWMWDPSYRLRRIHDMLSKADDLTIESMRAIQYDVFDKAAESFLPSMLEELEEQPITDPIQLKSIEALKNWNYVARVDTVAPAIWLRWLDHYRSAVWDPQWASRNIEKQSGSWGFTGINRREPTIEVLEYLTREKPDSPWFDNPTTSWTETRKDVAFGSFITAIGTLRRQLGDDIAGWEMRNTNILSVDSLLGIPELRRTGPPVPGTPFTVNPGGNIGHVGGGASWRMIVDVGDPSTSVGVYPGGQSADATSPHYDDMMPMWATGDYVALNAKSDSSDLPEDVRESEMLFVP